jgi:hypothetical protein
MVKILNNAQRQYFMNKPLVFLRNIFLISIRLFPAIYFLTLALASGSIMIAEATLGLYEVTFRPLIVSLLMLFVLWVLSLRQLKVFNKYFWCWVSGNEPWKVIYFWLSIIFIFFGLACLVAGLVTVFYGVENPYGMFNLREDIFFSAVAALIASPLVMSLSLVSSNPISKWLNNGR